MYLSGFLGEVLVDEVGIIVAVVVVVRLEDNCLCEEIFSRPVVSLVREEDLYNSPPNRK